MKDQHGNKIGIGILFGITTAVMISVGSAALLSVLALRETLSLQRTNVLVAVIHVIASLICGVVSGMTAGEKYAIVISGSVAGYYLILISITVFAFESAFGKVGLGALMCFAGAVVSCFLCVSRKGKRKFRY